MRTGRLLVVVGETFAGGKPGFVVLSDRTDEASDNDAAGEELLDHNCAILADGQ